MNKNTVCMDDLPSDFHGFTAKTVANPPGIHVRLPDTAVQFNNLAKGDLLHLQVRNQTGEQVKCSRKLQKSGSSLKFYLPKQLRQELNLESGEVVEVFYRKD